MGAPHVIGFALLNCLICLCLCWGLTSQSTIFQLCRDGATLLGYYQYFRGVKCLAQGHNTSEAGFEPPTSRSGVQRSTSEPSRSPLSCLNLMDIPFGFGKDFGSFVPYMGFGVILVLYRRYQERTFVFLTHGCATGGWL